jgi:hypothetical protein
VPGRDVDRPAFAVHAVRDLGPRRPARPLEHRDDDRPELDVPRVEQPVERPAAPPKIELDARIERPGHRPDRRDRHPGRLAALERRDPLLAATHAPGQIGLPPSPAPPKRPNRAPEANVIHARRSCTPPLTGLLPNDTRSSDERRIPRTAACAVHAGR